MTNDTNGTGGPTAQAVTSMASGATGPMADTLSRLPIFGPPPLLPGDDAKAYDDM